MRRIFATGGLLMAAAAALALSLAGPARADAGDPARWRGRTCTALGCAGRASAAWSAPAGFAAAALAGGWIARRRRSDPR